MKNLIALSAITGLLLFTIAPGRAEEVRYNTWQGHVQAGDMPELLKNLRTLTDQAERDKAADPVFLADLRAMTNPFDQAVETLKAIGVPPEVFARAGKLLRLPQAKQVSGVDLAAAI